MVYESDFYTTRRPYSRPALSSYSVTSPIRIIPGIARVHSVPFYYGGSPYSRIIVSRPLSLYSSDYSSDLPLTYSTVHSVPLYGAPLVHRSVIVQRPVSVYTPSPMSVVIRTRPSVLDREFDRIQRRVRPTTYKPVEDFLNSSSTLIRSMRPLSDDEVLQKQFIVSRPISLYPTTRQPFVSDFDDETRKIRSQANSLLTRIHTPVHRPLKTIFFSTAGGYGSITPSYPHLEEELSHIFQPLSNYRKNIGPGHLACVRYAGDKAYNKRKSYYPESGKIRNDVNLLSYYIQKRPLQLKALELESAKILCPFRPSRRFAQPKMLEDPKAELKEFKSARLERFNAANAKPSFLDDDDLDKEKKKRQAEARLADEKEEARRKEQAKRDAEAKAAEAAKKEELAKAAEAERKKAEKEAAKQAEEQAKKEAEEKAKKEAEEKALKEAEEKAKKEAEEKAKKEAEEKAKQEAEEKARQEAEQKAKEEAERKAKEEAEQKAKEEAEQKAREEEEKRIREEEMARLDEIARQAEEEKEAELARQAAELAEIARLEQELADQAKKEAEEEQAKKESEQHESEVEQPAEEPVEESHNDAPETTQEEVAESVPAESEEHVEEPEVEKPVESAPEPAEEQTVAEPETATSPEPPVESTVEESCEEEDE
ncbi:uncharacterized protein CG45076 [Ctenocephalides felis]|uniref:uncharacterized protein CG45076 n=1 Tax=Ctenocephalides felis TaxID=7515 RepID=UPI000E6E2E03|nr:uncharacterized protein CG45076 [Ctenocephalides felis]